MKAQALLILLLFPSLAPAQQPYYGTKAASVNLPPPADPRDTSRLKIHNGDVITVENIRSSIQALYEPGHYRTIKVEATAGPEGTQITFVVTGQYYFSTFRLEPENLLDRPITSFFSPPLGKKFSAQQVERLVSDTITPAIKDAGYFNTTITPEYSYDDKTRLVTVVFKTDGLANRAKIGTIHVNGGQQIVSDNEIRSLLKISRGDGFIADKIDKGVAKIRKKFVDKGYLTAKVRADRPYDAVMNTVDLNIEVDPGKITVVQVFEAGTSKSEIPNDKLRTLVPIYVEGTVDQDLVDEGKQHIEDYYKQLGYFEAKATSAMSAGPDQDVHVVYNVEKGEQHRVRSLRIEGSAFFPEADILKKMKTRAGKSASHGLYSVDLLSADIKVIEAMYLNAGFKSTHIDPPETPESPGHEIDITIRIHEGLRSTLDQITFTGNASFSEPEVWHQAGIQADQVYSTAIVDNARDALANFYYTQGFSEVHIGSTTSFVSEFNTVNVRFDVTEGPRYRIGDILVSGNTHTSEKVIRRESGLNQNGKHDYYNPEAILEAQQALYAQGIFNRVEIVAIDQDEESYKNLLIQVEDAKPILLTPGIGITELEGPRGTIEVSDTNLFGLGRTVSVRVRGGRRERQFQTSYRDPHLNNKNLLGIASLSFDKTQHPFFNSNEVDMSLQVVRKLSKKLNRTLSFSASYQTVNLQDIKVNPNIRRFPDTPGLIQIARLGSSFIGDRRDNVSDPTRGIFTTSSLEVANKLYGSEVNFIALFNQGSYFKPVHSGVLATSVRIGWKQPYGGDKELPISERYFAGGSTTLRGFKLDDAGPPGGGQMLTIANIEYRVPIQFVPIPCLGGEALKCLGGAVFYDTGNVFERPSDFGFAQFTHSVGAGLRYKTPVGPVRVDIGFNLRAKATDAKYRIIFTLGHAF